MTLNKIVACFAILLFSAAKSHACVPPEGEDNSLSQIKKKFDSVNAVLIARLTDSRKEQVKSNGSDFPMDAEIDTFVVLKSFKGRYKVGDRFVLTTVLGGCSASAVNDPPWIFNPETGLPLPISKDWLLYMNSSADTQIQKSPWTSPLDLVAHGELSILEEWRRSNIATLKKSKELSGRADDTSRNTGRLPR